MNHVRAGGQAVVVVAASAGGLSAFIELISILPIEFPAPIILVQHLPPIAFYQSQLREILGRYTRLPVKWIEHGESLCGGTIYLSPQDVQASVCDSMFHLAVEVRGLGRRPAADPLFSSIARCFGADAIGIVLTGVLSDGAEGAFRIAEAGGRVFVQDEKTALFFDMPHAAIRRASVDFVLPPSGIAHALIALLMAPGANAWFRVAPSKKQDMDFHEVAGRS